MTRKSNMSALGRHAAQQSVKKTKAGNFSVMVTFPTALELDTNLMKYFESECGFPFRATVDFITRHLYYTVLFSFYQRRHFTLTIRKSSSVMERVTFTISRAECLALIWFLRPQLASHFIELKAAMIKAAL